jgi:hypothetical protein
VHTINRQRLLLSLLLLALVPLAREVSPLVILGLMCALIVYERINYGEGRTRSATASRLSRRPPSLDRDRVSTGLETPTRSHSQ